MEAAYFHYCGCRVGDQEKSWATHISCTSCHTFLTQWLLGKRASMPFVVPMIWREQQNHDDDCYFCYTSIGGYNKKKKATSSTLTASLLVNLCLMMTRTPFHLQLIRTYLYAVAKRIMMMNLLNPTLQNHTF